jgi:phosphoribosylglycinamide formyltransferase-1
VSLKKIAILFSGEGTNLEALIKALHKKTFEGTTIEVALTLTNNPQANGIARARKYGFEPIIINHTIFPTREAFDTALVETILAHEIDLTVLAGFMRILTPIFTDQIRAINIHPSLLPLFKGADALKRSFESEMKVAGVTTHMVTTELDSGEIVDQICFSKEGMDFDTFKAEIARSEHTLYPQSVKKVLLN